MKEENGVDNQFTINITIGDMDFAIVGSSKLEWAQETKSILDNEIRKEVVRIKADFLI